MLHAIAQAIADMLDNPSISLAEVDKVFHTCMSSTCQMSKEIKQ